MARTPFPTSSTPDGTRWRRWMPHIVIVVGLCAAAALLSTVREPVFFSGDGGVKFLAVAQFARGEWTTEILLPSEPWLEALWRDGRYPLLPPFAYPVGERWVFGFPLAYAAATAPLWWLFGYPGLYVLPAAAWLAIAWQMGRLARRFGLSPQAGALAQASWALGSFATPYVAMFWEHLPAAALAFFGVAGAIDARRSACSTIGAFAAGLALGASGWLRPEGLVLTGIVVVACLSLAVHDRTLRGWLPFLLGAGVMVAAFLGSNAVAFSHPLGVHAAQILAPTQTWLDPFARPGVAGGVPALGWYFLRYAPMALVAAYLAVRLAARDPVHRREIILLALSALLFLVAVSAIVPNLGGKQWGPRYMLLLVPPMAWCIGWMWDEASRRLGLVERRGVMVLALAVLGYGALVNLFGAYQALAADYSNRILPAIEAIRAEKADVVATIDPFATQELAALALEDRFFAVLPPSNEGSPEKPITAFADALLATGRSRFLLVVPGPGAGEQPPPSFAMQGDRTRIFGLQLPGRPGHFAVFVLQTKPWVSSGER